MAGGRPGGCAPRPPTVDGVPPPGSEAKSPFESGSGRRGRWSRSEGRRTGGPRGPPKPPAMARPSGVTFSLGSPQDSSTGRFTSAPNRGAPSRRPRRGIGVEVPRPRICSAPLPSPAGAGLRSALGGALGSLSVARSGRGGRSVGPGAGPQPRRRGRGAGRRYDRFLGCGSSHPRRYVRAKGRVQRTKDEHGPGQRWSGPFCFGRPLPVGVLG